MEEGVPILAAPGITRPPLLLPPPSPFRASMYPLPSPLAAYRSVGFVKGAVCRLAWGRAKTNAWGGRQRQKHGVGGNDKISSSSKIGSQALVTQPEPEGEGWDGGRGLGGWEGAGWDGGKIVSQALVTQPEPTAQVQDEHSLSGKKEEKANQYVITLSFITLIMSKLLPMFTRLPTFSKHIYTWSAAAPHTQLLTSGFSPFPGCGAVQAYMREGTAWKSRG